MTTVHTPFQPPRVSQRRFGTMPDGTAVDAFTIDNGYIELSGISYGGIISSLRVPDRHGRRASIVLGFDTLEPYLDNRAYIGALAGRYANRIGGATFELDGVCHQLRANDGPNHLHGGPKGFSRQVWTMTVEAEGGVASLVQTRRSPAGEEGYPGTLDATVAYRVMGDTVVLEYDAVADAPTIVNLTQHSYFNLAPETSPTVLDHELVIAAGAYLPVDANLIPTGQFASVAETPFDFRQRTPIRSRIAVPHPDLDAAGGFDHTFVLADAPRPLTLAAALSEPVSGRVLELRTTEPGLQFYGGHLLEQPHAGLCLESQHFPDSPQRPSFPSVVLRPGERYRSMTTWRFAVRAVAG